MRLWAQKGRRCDCVCPQSPARLLAKSLTDPETRDEWVKSYRFGHMSVSAEYTNASRDLVIICSGYGVSTPFTLNEAEQEFVREATKAFDARQKEIEEAAAFVRLTAPKRRGKAK